MTEKLSEPMKDLLRSSRPGVVVASGPTRAALMRRGLVHNFANGYGFPGGCLTEAGAAAREFLLGGPLGTVTMIGKRP